MTRMDLNCDVGEVPEAVTNGTQDSIMRSVTSVNVACGGHAGDARTMAATIEQALRWNLALGAHPGYPDRANFGRLELELPAPVVSDFVFEQVRAFAEAAEKFGARVTHVKPHGALYNQAASKRALAEAIAAGVARWRRDVALVGLAGSLMLDVFQQAGFRAVAEAFADRRYEPDGTLRSRKFEDALIRDPELCAQQALDIAARSSVSSCDGTQLEVDAQTICIHGDGPNASKIAAAVAHKLRQTGIEVRHPFF
jgi:5-oxoprolinase (ATP-hydrolysing) subunit A